MAIGKKGQLTDMHDKNYIEKDYDKLTFGPL